MTVSPLRAAPGVATLIPVSNHQARSVYVTDEDGEADRYYRAAAAAEIAGVSRWTLGRAADAGEIPYVMAGNQRRFRHSDLVTWRDSKTSPARERELERRVAELEAWAARHEDQHRGE